MVDINCPYCKGTGVLDKPMHKMNDFELISEIHRLIKIDNSESMLLAYTSELKNRLNNVLHK